MLVVIGGLPGVGKTTLARELAQRLDAVYLRIDSIEQALRDSGSVTGPMDDIGYRAAYAAAEKELRAGRIVIADCVNPLRLTRDAWIAVAAGAGVRAAEVEVTCSDPQAHRRRVETRVADIRGLKLPTWDEVVNREYEPWERARIVIDTNARTVSESLSELLQALQQPSSR